MKRLLAVFLAFFAITLVFAEDVSPDRALSMAREFLNNGSTKFNASAGRNLTLAYQARSHEGKPDYYVFNLEGNGGFLVVTGDDRTMPVWGYSTSGSFDFESMPDNMKWWFSEYQRQLQYLRDNPNANPRHLKTRLTSVGPLLATEWGQNYPFNNMCPNAFDPLHPDYHDKAPSGCFATAFAQIMNHYKWPKVGSGSIHYSCDVTFYELNPYWSELSPIEIDMYDEKSYTAYLGVNFSNSVYNWDLIEGFNLGITEHENIDAVAKLIYDVGVAIKTNYSARGSSADWITAYNNIPIFFNYNPRKTTREEWQNKFPDIPWDDMLRASVDNNHPLFYYGYDSDKNVGHGFVLDGYNSDGFFHFNWSWGDTYWNDCYFASELIVPVDGHTYSSDQAVLLIIPNYENKSLSGTLQQSSIGTNVGSTMSTGLSVMGQNLDQDVSISVSGDASMFSTVSSISAAEANSDEGKTVKLVYRPTKAGTHTAHLTLSAGEGVDPVQLTVTGSASVYCDADGNEDLNIDDLVYAVDQALLGGTLENTGAEANIDDLAEIVDALLGISPSIDINDGLVAYYPFDGNANDLSGNGNHGQVTNLTLTRGVSGDTRGAYLFGGFYNQGHIRIPNSASLKFTDGFTFACYVKPTSWGGMDGWANYVASGGNQCIFAKSTDRNGPHLSFSGDDSGMNVKVGTMHSASQWTSIATDGQFQGNHKNEWVHVAVTYSKKQARLYIDGNLVKQKNITANFSTLNTNDFYLGAFPRPESGIDWWCPMNGVMDEVRIYNRELNPAEVNELAMDNLEDIEEKNPFKLSTSAVTLAVGETVTVNMLNGSGNYSLGSNIGIVDFALNGDSFTLTGKDVGTTNVTVIDVTTQTTILLPVTVTQPIDNHEWVDLGLPSGTLWATCNVGANTPEEYGDYFAWGETEPKDYYGWNTYKWCNGSRYTLTKYCTDSSYGYNGFVDNKAELDPEDDAAYVNWGSSWRIPTTEQQCELYENCSVDGRRRTVSLYGRRRTA